MTDKVETKKPKAKAPAKAAAPAKKVAVKVKAPAKVAVKAEKPVAKKPTPKKVEPKAPAKPPVKKKDAESNYSASSLIQEAMAAAAVAAPEVIPEKVLTPQEKKEVLPTVAPAVFKTPQSTGGEKISYTDLMAKRGAAVKVRKDPFAGWTTRSN